MASFLSTSKKLYGQLTAGLFVILILFAQLQIGANQAFAASHVPQQTHSAKTTVPGHTLGKLSVDDDFSSFHRIVAEEDEEENEACGSDSKGKLSQVFFCLEQACTLHVKSRFLHLTYAYYNQPRVSLFILHHSWKAHLG